MSLAVVFDEYSLPEKGENIQLEIKRSFSINLTAKEAKKKVNDWLFMDVSMMIAADEPTLAISRDAVAWRVPAILYSTQQGLVGQVGHVDVNVQTAEIDNTQACQAKIEFEAEQLMQHLPPYQQQQDVSAQFLDPAIPSAPKLILTDEDFDENTAFPNAPILVPHGEFDLAWLAQDEQYTVLSL